MGSREEINREGELGMLGVGLELGSFLSVPRRDPGVASDCALGNFASGLHTLSGKSCKLGLFF